MEGRNSGLDSRRFHESTILTNMRIHLSDLRRIIREAVVDQMRLPRGPNSRDDAEDRDLNDPAKDRINIEETDLNSTKV